MRKKAYLALKIKKIFSKLNKGIVLDLGSGEGEHANILKNMGFDVVTAGIDNREFKYPDLIKFTFCDLSNAAPFKNASFDYVLFLEILEHIRNPYFAIREISRVLKPEGLLFLSTPNILNITSRLRFLFEGSFDFFREPILDYSKIQRHNLDNMHIMIWRYQEIEYLLFENGLHVENIYTDLFKTQAKILSVLLLPLLKFQNYLKRKKALKKKGIDFNRIDKILFSKELLWGRHLIIKATRKQK